MDSKSNLTAAQASRAPCKVPFYVEMPQSALPGALKGPLGAPLELFFLYFVVQGTFHRNGTSSRTEGAIKYTRSRILCYLGDALVYQIVP